MWTLTPDDIRRAKNELIQRRNDTKTRYDAELKAIEAKHDAELKAIDGELTEITAIEQAADAFARKYKPDASLNNGEPQELATRLTLPAKLTVSARNWGDARFTPAVAAQADRA